MKYLLLIYFLISFNFSYSQNDYKFSDFGFNTRPLKVFQYKFTMPDSILNEIVEYNFDEKGYLISKIEKSSFSLPDTMIWESLFYYNNLLLQKIIMQGKGFNKDSRVIINYKYSNNELQNIDYFDGNKHEYRLYKYDDLALKSEMSYLIDTLLSDKYQYHRNNNGKIIKQIHNKYYSNYTTTEIDSFVYVNTKERFWFSSWDYNFDKGKRFSIEYYDDNNNYVYSMIENKYPTSKYKYDYDSKSNWTQRRFITKEGDCIELITRDIFY